MESRKIKEVVILIYTKLEKGNYTKLGKLILEINVGPLFDKGMKHWVDSEGVWGRPIKDLLHAYKFLLGIFQ